MKTKIQRNSWPQTSVLLLVSEVARLPSTPLVQSKEWTQTEYLGNTYDICYIKLIIRDIHSTYTYTICTFTYAYIYIWHMKHLYDICQSDLETTTSNDGRQQWIPPCTEERTQENSTFRPLTAGGIRQSIFVLVQTSLGGGQLMITCNLQSTLRVSFVCCFCVCVFFWLFSIFDLFESILYFCWFFLYNSIASMFYVGRHFDHRVHDETLWRFAWNFAVDHCPCLNSKIQDQKQLECRCKRTSHQTVMMQCDESWCHGFISCFSLCCRPRDWYSGLGCLDALGHTCMHLFPALNLLHRAHEVCKTMMNCSKWPTFCTFPY